MNKDYILQPTKTNKQNPKYRNVTQLLQKVTFLKQILAAY